MTLFASATLVLPPHGGQDRLAVRQFDDRIVLALSDGVGGIRGGAEAAQWACDRAIQQAIAPGAAFTWADRLQTIDAELMTTEHGGQCTLVVAEFWNGQIVGASVGDSEAWLFGNDEDPRELTEQQERKPVLGSGSARACAFGPVEINDRRLLIASDGLFRYAAPDKIAQRVWSTAIPQLPSLLADLARLPTGELQDDVAIVVCAES